MKSLETESEPSVHLQPGNLSRFSIRFLLVIVFLAAVCLAILVPFVGLEIPGPTSWDLTSGKNIKWKALVGSPTYSNPVVHAGFVFVGTNNQGGHDPLLNPTIDAGVMICFDKETGEFLWQYASPKLAVGGAQDWPTFGITSQPCAIGSRMWFVTNRCEVVCLDTGGFRDGQNAGPFQNEKTTRDIDADVVWKFDMIGNLGVYPHNISHCNVVVDEKHVFVKTSNGVDPSHQRLPSPNAPSFLVLDRKSGQVVWQDSTLQAIFHGSWGSPTLATIAGKRQVLFPGGDGWLYSFEPAGNGQGQSVLLWKFDCNPKTSSFDLSATCTRNNLLTAPTVEEDRVYITLGRDPEHGEGPSRVWCIEPGNRRGDLSPTLVVPGPKYEQPGFGNDFVHCIAANGDTEVPNPNSALVWEYTGSDRDNDGMISGGEVMNRSLSRVVVKDEFLLVSDIYGTLHCLDKSTGALNWHFDTFAAIWTTPEILGEHIYLADQDGIVNVFRASADPKVAMVNNRPVAVSELPRSIYTNPTMKRGVIYLITGNELLAIEDPETRSNPLNFLKR